MINDLHDTPEIVDRWEAHKQKIRNLAQFSPEDSVELDFYKSGRIPNCVVGAVKLTDDGKVLYDIHVPVREANEWSDGLTTLHDVDSVFVFPKDYKHE